MTFRIARIAN